MMDESMTSTKGSNRYPPAVLVLAVNIMIMILSYSTYQQCVFGMWILSVECIRVMLWSYDQVGPIGHGHVDVN